MQSIRESLCLSQTRPSYKQTCLARCKQRLHLINTWTPQTHFVFFTTTTTKNNISVSNKSDTQLKKRKGNTGPFVSAIVGKRCQSVVKLGCTRFNVGTLVGQSATLQNNNFVQNRTERSPVTRSVCFLGEQSLLELTELSTLCRMRYSAVLLFLFSKWTEFNEEGVLSLLSCSPFRRKAVQRRPKFGNVNICHFWSVVHCDATRATAADANRLQHLVWFVNFSVPHKSSQTLGSVHRVCVCVCFFVFFSFLWGCFKKNYLLLSACSCQRLHLSLFSCVKHGFEKLVISEIK